MERHGEPDGAGSAPPQRAGAGSLPGAPGAAPEAVTITLPAQPRYFRVARLVAAGLANELGFGLDRLDDVRLAIGESCGLAAQAGAHDVSLAYVLDERSLTVTIDASLDGADGHLEAEYVALVEQVLTIACSDHSVDRDDRRLSMRVTFANGS